MKTTIAKLSFFCLLVIAAVSCQKTPEMPDHTTVHLTTYDAREITAVSAVVDARSGADYAERGVCWSTIPGPTVADFHVANGHGEGGYSCTLTGLEPNKKYYYRAYISDGKNYGYANELSFTTRAGDVTLTTAAATGLGSTYATLGGEVIDNGGFSIIERGVCYGTEPGTSIEGLHAASSDTTKVFAVALTGLENETMYYYKAYVKNQQGYCYGEELTFTTLDGRPVVSTGNTTEITATSAKCSGEVADEGHAPVTGRGICWSKNLNPTLENANHIASGSGTGTFDVELAELEENTLYHVCAYATNALGTRYGNDETFITLDGLPTVVTRNVTEITVTSAKCSGNVTHEGYAPVTERGICWSKDENPSFADIEHFASGSGTGSFDVNLSNLDPNTTYHVWAYAKNDYGTSYGNRESFTTVDGLPIVITGDVTDITATTAQCSGEVVDDGGFAVSEYGICWSENDQPTILNNHEAAGSGVDSFSATLSDLSEGTTYYYCAYAKNTAGIVYGLVKHFKTLPEGAIPAKFSVSWNTQVYFSKGNLQYKASTNTWRFAENQWDIVGEANVNASSTYHGWIDLFAWGTSGYNHCADGYQPWASGSCLAYGDGYANLFSYTGQADWGYNAISNGGNTEHQWHTLSGGKNGEWDYLLNSRSTASGIRYAKACVNGVNGIILVPDNWSASTYTLYSTNNGTAAFSSNTISSSVWNATLEPAGCVFLPAAGYNCSEYNSVGCYWSSTYYNWACANDIAFSDGSSVNAVGGYNFRYYKNSVRLVCFAGN